MLLALDEGDSTTTTERALIAQEEDEDVRGTVVAYHYKLR